MTTASHIEPFTADVRDSADAPRRDRPRPDPFVLGLPLIAAGAIALGLQLVGFVNVNSSGSPLAVLIGAGGLGLLLATVWAASLRTVPEASLWARGTSLPATVLGTLATFFISYATLVLGLAHGWLTVRPSEAQHTVALFQISWLVVFILLGLASVRLPAVFTALFASFAGALALLLISTLGPSTLAGNLAGVAALLIGAAAGYVFLAVASRASGGREYPIGRPIAR